MSPRRENSEGRGVPVQSTQPGVSMALVFMTVVTALVVVTAGAILAIVNESARTSIKELLREKAEIVSYTIVERVRNSLEPVSVHSKFAAQIISETDLGDMNDEEIGALLYISLAALPQVSSVALVNEEIHLIRSFRNRPSLRSSRDDWSDDPGFSEMIRTAWSAKAPYWGPLFYAETSQTTLLNFIAPVRKNGETIFVLVSSVSLSDLSLFILSLRNEMTGQSFVLFGEDALLAYSAVPEIEAELSDQNPLPYLSDFTDTPLAHIWSPNRRHDIEMDLSNGMEARVVDESDGTVVFLFRRLDGFGENPWFVGSHFALDQLAPQLARSETAITVSVTVIAISALIALFLSRMVSRPIRTLSISANKVNNWKIEQAISFPKSIFKEINEANSAFNYMLRAFESLQVYIPSALARRLIERGDAATIRSEEHTISILFTDIVDFTGLAEERSPKDVVEFLNAHFALLAECIEAEQGVVDKFIGDSAMAFWGGLERDQDHATHACRAALRIEEAMYHENGVRRANGKRPVQLRIGIHSGKAMLGNIGSAGRINYTVIGDTVNTAQRLERLARDVDGEEAEVVTLISGDTAMQLGQDFLISPIGRKVLHGRHEETEVFILKSGHSSAASKPAG